MSDLALLLLGFLVVWYLLDKSNLSATNLPSASAEIEEQPKSLPSSDGVHVDPRDWQTMGEEMQRFVVEIGLAKEVVIESAPNEIIISSSDTVPFDFGKGGFATASHAGSSKSRGGGFES